MMQPACIASFASRSNQLHIFTEKALETVIDQISMESTYLKLEGFDISQWAAFAKKKSNIASSICKELGRLQAFQSVFTRTQACENDPFFRSDPWVGASLKLDASRSKPGDNAQSPFSARRAQSSSFLIGGIGLGHEGSGHFRQKSKTRIFAPSPSKRIPRSTMYFHCDT